MASGVKWIKITTDIFDDEKILLIESMPSADSIIVIWFKLLAFAGKQNNDGVFLMSNRIAYTEEMLASIFRRDIKIVRLALNTFQSFGMIEIFNDVITIPNWNKHQTLDAYEKKKERDRIYQQNRRAAQKALIEKSSDISSDVAFSDKEKDIDIEEDKDINNNMPDSDESAPAPKKKPVKHKYGEFQNVLLTDNEFENLANSFGIELRDKAIKLLDEYIEEKGYKSKSHNLAIRRWVIDAVKEKSKKQGRQEPVPAWMKKNGFNDFAQKKNDAALEEMEGLFLQEVNTINNDPKLAERAAKLQEELKGR